MSRCFAKFHFLSRCLARGCVGLVVAALLVASDAQEPITRIADARGLLRDEAAKALPVRVRGVVAWRGAGPMAGFMVVQDESAGIFVNRDVARERALWSGDDAVFAGLRVGSLVEIEGVSDRGGISPTILPRALRVVGEQALPVARKTSPAWFFSGADDCQRIELRAVVQGVRVRNGYLTLMMDANPGPFMTLIPDQELTVADAESLVDAEVRLVGEPHSRFNTRGEFLMPSLMLNGAADLVVEKAAPSRPFEAEKVPLDGIAQFRVNPLQGHRLLVEGTVTFTAGSGLLFLQDGANGVRVKVRDGEAVQIGDRVEVTGFVDESQRIRGLKEALVRKIGSGAVAAPLDVGPDEILAVNAKSARTSLIASPGDFDGRLIHFEARLVEVLNALAGQQRLVLATRASSVIATLQSGDASALAGLSSGSRLAVTGIAQLAFDPDAFPGGAVPPVRVDVLLRSRDDIVVLDVPSWWTRTRALYALGGGVLAFGAAMVWGWQLRWRVKVQGAQLAEEMRARRESAVEFQATLRERNRLAANLHDTLLQTVGGIGYQLDACESSVGLSGASPLPQLGVARRMVDHAAAELRGSVWALRALPLHGRSFPEALKDLAAHVGMGHGALIEVRTEGVMPEVPEFIAGNLLLIVQEAIHNALKHGHPQHIEVTAQADGDEISVTVLDDGPGFAMGTESGPAQGHFGLAGMKERTDRLGGSLHIESAPGRGTTIRARVALRDFDEEVA